MALLVFCLTCLSLLPGVFSESGKGLCPDRERCSTDPCLTASCPLYPHAVCVPNNCNNSCKPAFFHKSNLEIEITGKCNQTSCSVTECPERRVCIEEIVPISCPRHKCRHHIRSRCVPASHPSPPTECHRVSCPTGLVCSVVHTKNGKRAHCVERKPGSCSELGPCDSGMVCKVREGRGHAIAHCTPEHVSRNPRDCSQLKCRKGSECVVFGTRHAHARCVSRKPSQKTCNDLDCLALNMSCRQTNKGPKCFVPSRCEELTCTNEQYCMLSTFHSRNLTIAECVQRNDHSCDPSSHKPCAGSQLCLGTSQEHQYTATTQCVHTDCSITPCPSPSQSCVTLPEPLSHTVGVRSVCLSSAHTSSLHIGGNCSSNRPALCPTRGVRGTFSACQELSVGRVTLGSVCSSPSDVPAVSCEGVSCEGDRECVERVTPGVGGGVTQADCVPSVLIDNMFK